MHFMWGFQPHFRAGVEWDAKKVLGALEPTLKPRAFLIGVRITDDAQRAPACVEPEVHHWAESSDFYDVISDVETIKNSYSESQVLHTHPIAQQNADNQLFRRALRDAVLRRLENCSGRPSGLQVFASMPVERDGFLVLTVITVDAIALSKVPAVADSEIPIHSHRSFHVPRSLVEAAIEEVLAQASREIIRPDAGSGLSILGSAEETLRAASVAFFSGLLHRVDLDSRVASVATSVYDAILRLSLTRYERADPSGSLLITDKKADFDNAAVTLAVPVSLYQRRALRKLLVMANNGLSIHCNCEKAFSLVSRKLDDLSRGKRALEIRVIGRGKWAASMDGRELFVVADGYPALPKPLVDRQRVSSDLRRSVPSMDEMAAGAFADIAVELAGAGHGSLLVIAPDAADEASRLANDGLLLAPVPLTPALASRLTQIDGAILCSPDGVCHAAGVILDGSSVASGRPRKGRTF